MKINKQDLLRFRCLVSMWNMDLLSHELLDNIDTDIWTIKALCYGLLQSVYTSMDWNQTPEVSNF